MNLVLAAISILVYFSDYVNKRTFTQLYLFVGLSLTTVVAAMYITVTLLYAVFIIICMIVSYSSATRRKEWESQ